MKLSEYILEQNISSASCDDIEVAQLFAEMEVLSSLMECYTKQEMIAEYASCDLSEFDIFVEADTSTTEGNTSVKKENIFKKAWHVIVKFIKKIGEMFVKLFSKFKFKTLEEKIIKSDIETYQMSSEVILNVRRTSKIIEAYNDFIETIRTSTEEEEILSAVDEILHVFHGYENMIKSTAPVLGYEDRPLPDSTKVSKDDLLEIVRLLKNCQEKDIPKTKKELKMIDSMLMTNKVELTEDSYKKLKEAVKELHNGVVTLNKSSDDLLKAIVNPQLKHGQYHEYYTGDTYQEGVVACYLSGVIVGTAVKIIRDIKRRKDYNEATEELITDINEALGIIDQGPEVMKKKKIRLARILRGIWKNSYYAAGKNLDVNGNGVAFNAWSNMTASEMREFRKVLLPLMDSAKVLYELVSAFDGRLTVAKDRYNFSDKCKDFVDNTTDVLKFIEKNAPNKK